MDCPADDPNVPRAPPAPILSTAAPAPSKSDIDRDPTRGGAVPNDVDPRMEGGGSTRVGMSSSAAGQASGFASSASTRASSAGLTVNCGGNAKTSAICQVSGVTGDVNIHQNVTNVCSCHTDSQKLGSCHSRQSSSEDGMSTDAVSSDTDGPPEPPSRYVEPPPHPYVAHPNTTSWGSVDRSTAIPEALPPSRPLSLAGSSAPPSERSSAWLPWDCLMAPGQLQPPNADALPLDTSYGPGGFGFSRNSHEGDMTLPASPYVGCPSNSGGSRHQALVNTIYESWHPVAPATMAPASPLADVPPPGMIGGAGGAVRYVSDEDVLRGLIVRRGPGGQSFI